MNPAGIEISNGKIRGFAELALDRRSRLHDVRSPKGRIGYVHHLGLHAAWRHRLRFIGIKKLRVLHKKLLLSHSVLQFLLQDQV